MCLIWMLQPLQLNLLIVLMALLKFKDLEAFQTRITYMPFGAIMERICMLMCRPFLQTAFNPTDCFLLFRDRKGSINS